MQRVSPTVAVVGVGLVVGLIAAARRAKAAQAQPSSLPSEVPTPPKPPLLTSTAEEGKPLAWDRSEHPLAERDSRVEQGASARTSSDPATQIEVSPAIWVDVEADASNVKEYSAAELAELERRAAERSAQNPLDRGVVRPPAAKPAAPAAPPAPAASKPKPKPKPAAAAPAAPPAAAPSAPAGRTPVQAARELYEHASALLSAGKGSQLGVKGKPSSVVLAAQRDMGGLTADGMYGPATRERGKQLTGQTFPVRK